MSKVLYVVSAAGNVRHSCRLNVQKELEAQPWEKHHEEWISADSYGSQLLYSCTCSFLQAVGKYVLWFLQFCADRTHCWRGRIPDSLPLEYDKVDTAKLSVKLDSALKVWNLLGIEHFVHCTENSLNISCNAFWHIFTELGKVLIIHVADKKKKKNNSRKIWFNLFVYLYFLFGDFDLKRQVSTRSLLN